VIFLAKKKRSTTIKDTARNNHSEQIPKIDSNKGPTNNITYIAIIAGLLLVIAYLLSGGGSNQADYPTGPPPDISTDIHPILFTGNIPEPVLKPEFALFFPDNISGMRRVTLLMDPMNDETGGRFISKVQDKANLMYLSESILTDFEIEYTVYKMDSPEAAREVLDFYTTEMGWNTLQKSYGNVTFRIWQGYLEGKGRPYGMYIYWDSISGGAYLPIEKQGTSYIAQANANLLCLHGETVQDEYFIMVDVHAPFEKVNEVSDQMFTEAASLIAP
jgi:hypothetical protein